MNLLERIAFTATPMRDGWSGIEQAVHAMQCNVECSLLDQRVRQACIEILHNARARGGDRHDEARAIFDFVLGRVEYRRDPAWLEFIQDPRALLAHIETTERLEGRGRGWAAGDCDDHAQLVQALAFQVRLPVVSVLVAEHSDFFRMSRDALLVEMVRAFREGRRAPVHVYAALRAHKYAEPSQEWLEGDDEAESGLISLDTARPGATFGEHVPGLVRYVRPATTEV